MSNKTALQQLIDKLKAKGEMFELLTYDSAIQIAESFLEVEKQQIIDAFHSVDIEHPFDGIDYYCQKYTESQITQK